MIRRRILRIKLAQALYAYGYHHQLWLKNNGTLAPSRQKILRAEGLRWLKQDLSAMMEGYELGLESLRWVLNETSHEGRVSQSTHKAFAYLCRGGSVSLSPEIRQITHKLWRTLEIASGYSSCEPKHFARFADQWLSDDSIADVREAQDSRWTEHRNWIKETLIRQLKAPIPSKALSVRQVRQRVLNEGSTFLKTLFYEAVAQYEFIELALNEQLEHWHVARLSGMDKALLHAALSETQINTPKEVLFNETIEIAKTYGTPKSHTFINGVLEAMYLRAKTQASAVN